jgi:predicted ATPase
MYHLLISPLSVAITLTTAFGVIIHDTRIDRATSTALAAPAVIASYGVADVLSKLSDVHTHTERVHMASEQPRVQPRSGDDKKYITGKKFSYSSYGSEYSWPSI